jgi:hypothetical protein
MHIKVKVITSYMPFNKSIDITLILSGFMQIYGTFYQSENCSKINQRGLTVLNNESPYGGRKC